MFVASLRIKERLPEKGLRRSHLKQRSKSCLQLSLGWAMANRWLRKLSNYRRRSVGLSTVAAAVCLSTALFVGEKDEMEDLPFYHCLKSCHYFRREYYRRHSLASLTINQHQSGGKRFVSHFLGGFNFRHPSVRVHQSGQKKPKWQLTWQGVRKSWRRCFKELG